MSFKVDILSKLEEEKNLRIIRAKRRFKALVRQVINNLPWLIEFEQEIGDDVSLNVTMLTRTQNLTKALTLKDKLVLRKCIADRTEEDIKHLDSCIGGFKCFRRYPEDVKYKLVGVTYFEFFNAGRVLMKQGHKAHSLYFLLSGEVAVSLRVFDEVTGEWYMQEVGTREAGNMFGEVSLLHNIPRTATITTITPCELLCLKKEDFDYILKDTLMKQWDDIKNSMNLFPYFKGWDEVAIRECCLLSTLKQFEPNQTIFGDGVGDNSMVYFITEGECRILENIYVTEENKNGKKVIKLYEDNFRPITMNIKKSVSKILRKKSSYKKPTSNKNDMMYGTFDILKFDAMDTRVSKKISDKFISNKSDLRTISVQPPEIQFLQVCILRAKSCFHEDIISINRRAISINQVKCLLIPKYWLEQHNTIDIWSRIDDYLSNHIPTTNQLLEFYIKHIRWMNYRKRLSEEILSKRKFPNSTTIHDVPYSIRIQEEIE